MDPKRRFTTPGVYIQQVGNTPNSIAQVETAIPTFIGYTETAIKTKADDLNLTPFMIRSLAEYERHFGTAQPEGASITVELDTSVTPATAEATIDESQRSKFLMYYSLQAYFDNGGQTCYIVSVGNYGNDTIAKDDLSKGLKAIQKIDKITLIVFPDSIRLDSANDYYDLHNESLTLCANLRDRFTVMDVWVNPSSPDHTTSIDTLRNSSLGSSTDILQFGAVYYPLLETLMDFVYDPDQVKVDLGGQETTLIALKTSNPTQFNLAKAAIDRLPIILPAASAVVGVYVKVDQQDGVWKAPANININRVIKPIVDIDNQQQEGLNVDPVGGKSINAIRSFKGRGPALIWGARTLAGNDLEWRYVSVRRTFCMVEESIKHGLQSMVFEPNDANTWTTVKNMVENYLTTLWQQGAMAGTTAHEAFFVKVGLGTTMTAQDIQNDRMIVQIGIAIQYPAEFIIIQIVQKMAGS